MWTNFNISYPISTYQVMFTLTDLDLEYHKVVYHPTMELLNTNLFCPIWSRSKVEKFIKPSGVMSEYILHSDWYRKISKTVTCIEQLAIPTMPVDVMAKWRLILYKESLVTYNEETDSSAQERELAHTVAHGMVHQVIDSAITPSWWSHLWLNEGFAALLHVEILDEIFLKWKFVDLFVVQVQQDCLHLDTDFTMKPLSYEVRTPSEIKSLFSFPIYIKAPVILLMIQHIMGKEFQDIIKNYTNTYFRKSPTPDDLWNMMQVNLDNPELGNPTMKDIMENWVRENNYPIVNVRRTELTLEISQDECINEHYQQKALQWIPITFTTWEQLDFDNTTPHHWIPPKDSTKYNISISLTNKNGWIILNLQQTETSHFLPFEESKTLKEDMRLILKGLLENIYKEKSQEDDLTKWLAKRL
ncbi:aminopeptidase N isoform X1 [Ooceraea biroi]|uniref:aminopeptidase N isoform X1 n=1 Tax=Ooceraea biroi TaxID=2015173 RepID=UPI0005B9270F|nr:aminopeptidase N isoform X1 [Ooceraea biroi]